MERPNVNFLLLTKNICCLCKHIVESVRIGMVPFHPIIYIVGCHQFWILGCGPSLITIFPEQLKCLQEIRIFTFRMKFLKAYFQQPDWFRATC